MRVTRRGVRVAGCAERGARIVWFVLVLVLDTLPRMLHISMHFDYEDEDDDEDDLSTLRRVDVDEKVAKSSP